jgi:release factor glutamine methyltransferase
MHWTDFPQDNSAVAVRLWLQHCLSNASAGVGANARERAQVADAIIRTIDDRSQAVLEALDRRFGESELNRMAAWLQRLSEDEPWQYVLGWTEFCGLRLQCAPGALIPRPETEELVGWSLEKLTELKDGVYRVLDVGTGTGCIALALKSSRPEVEVRAWDVSEAAIAVAIDNAESTGLDVLWKIVDVLDLHASVESSPDEGWDLMVSNPPYIPAAERAEMEAHVTEHEPESALFVPDRDPLLFYNALEALASATLAPGGVLIVECHQDRAHEVSNSWLAGGWTTEVHVDMQGKKRAVSAWKSDVN